MFDILLMAIANRVRGTTSIAVWLMAYIYSGYFGFNMWVILAFVLGEATSWGAPLGAVLQRRQQGEDKEWWQMRFLSSRPQLSLLLRAAWWGACPAVAAYYSGSGSAIIVFVSIAVPFAVAPYISRNIKQSYVTPWQFAEFICGGLMGLTLEILI